MLFEFSDRDAAGLQYPRDPSRSRVTNWNPNYLNFRTTFSTISPCHNPIGDYLPDIENLLLFFANNAGVLLEGGNMFVANSDGYIRLNLACPRSIVKEGVRRICEAINTRRC